MFRFRRWYNQNRKTIWRTIIIIVFLIVLIQFLNYMVVRKYKTNNSDVNNIANNNYIENTYTDISLNSDKSAVTNEKMSSNQTNKLNTINDFFAYCNKKEIQKAYNLLTDECKEQMYPSKKDFEKGYYQSVFDGKNKNIVVENWISNIYKVTINDDFLSTGNYIENTSRQDYITIEKDNNDQYKLNINGYIGRNQINKSNKLDDIEIEVLQRDTYMDYVIYTFNIKNNRDNPVLIDNLKDIHSMYIEDENNMKYTSYSHEKSIGELLINPRETKKISIKYYSKYTSGRVFKEIVFGKVILDYNSYSILKDTNKYSNYSELRIGI